MSTATIQTLADTDGTRVDTGYHVGERVIATIGGVPEERVVVGPASRPIETLVWQGRRWGHAIQPVPALRVAPADAPYLWVDVPLSRIERSATVARS